MKCRAVVTVVFCLAMGAHATPREDYLSLGARALAMGKTGVAASLDFSSLYLNPANLSLCKSHEVAAGLRFVSTGLTATSAQNGNLHAEQLGLYQNFEVGSCLVPFEGMGVGLYATGNLVDPITMRLTTYDTVPRFDLFDNSNKIPVLMAGLGYAFLKELSVGVALAFSINTEIFQDVFVPLTDDLTSTFSTKITANIRPTASVIAGVNVRPFDFVQAGFSFRSASYGEFRVRAQTDTKLVVNNPPLIFDLEGQLDFSPSQYAFGIALKPIKGLTITSDVVYATWSAYKGPFLDVTPGEGSAISSVVRLPEQDDWVFSNIWMVHSGAEMWINDLIAVRLGYAYRQSPHPKPTGAGNLLDGPVHTVSLGSAVSFDVGPTTPICAFFVAADIMPNISTTKSSNSDVLTYGGSNIIGGLSTQVLF